MQKHPGCRAIFPTPLAGDGKKMSSMSKARKASGRKPDSLPEYVRMWPTPTARDHKDTGDCANVPVNALLGRAVGPSRMSGSLNPWLPEPNVGRVAHGVPRRVDRLRALGNAVVPQVVQVIGEAIMRTAR